MQERSCCKEEMVIQELQISVKHAEGFCGALLGCLHTSSPTVPRVGCHPASRGTQDGRVMVRLVPLVSLSVREQTALRCDGWPGAESRS